MNFKRMKELTLQIAKLQSELDKQKKYALKYCKELGISKLTKKNGVVIHYYPASTSTRVDTQKLKKAGIYDLYTTKIPKKEYVQIAIKEI